MQAATEEEERLLELLTPERWKELGLKDVLVTDSRMTPAGVEADLELSGNMSREKLTDATDRLRLLLDVEDDHPLVILPRGGARRARLAVRTRRVTEEMDMLWHPGRSGIGVDSVTGSVVNLPLNSQIQVAGAKGSGKSWAFRPLMASLVTSPHHEMVFMDPKVVEGGTWKGVVPTYFPGEFADALEEGVEDMYARRDLMQREGATVWRPEFGPYRIYMVDEGREFLSDLKLADKRAERLRKAKNREASAEDLLKDDDESGALLNLIRISSMGRAWGVYVWWATQYPIVSGNNPGMDTNVDANADWRFCLRVAKRKHADVALDDDADYGPHLLTADDRNRGFGYLGGHGPSLIQTWTLTDEMIPLLAYPDHGRGQWPRDAALAALRGQPNALWTPDLLATHTGCGRVQAARFLNSFSREGLMRTVGDKFLLADCAGSR